MAGQFQKLKILYLMQILLEDTDENHPLTAQELIVALGQRGIDAERKSIYSDIEALQMFGMDIVQKKGRDTGYYIGSRKFELAELKLLVDAVQASKFITTKKSEELIKKLGCLTSRTEAGQLRRQVFIFNRIKTGNERIYYTVDLIHKAISENRKIRFQYAEWTVKKELHLKKNGDFYLVSPWALTWDDENYYLIAYEELSGFIKHYRVDKMQHLEELSEERCGLEPFEQFDLAAFTKRTFGMYGGSEELVTLQCHNELAGVILDRFGRDTMMIPSDEEHFHVNVPVTVSRQFYGWVTGVGSMMEIAGPEKVRQGYRAYLKGIMGLY